MYLVFQVKPTFTFDDRGVYANNAVWIIPKNDKYLLALLNSNLGWFLISNYCTQIRNGYQLIYKYLKHIPILKIDENNSKDINIHKRIVKLVEQMLQVNKDLIDVKTHDRKVNMQRQIHAMDKQIDKLVYGLYGLKEDEIKIIENSLNLEGD